MDKLIHCSSYLYHVAAGRRSGGKIGAHRSRGLTKTFFGNGGAEAIEGALKLARLYTGKHEFIALHGSFHGRSWGALSITGKSRSEKTRWPLCFRNCICSRPVCLPFAVAQRSRRVRAPMRELHRRNHSLRHCRRRSRIHR